MCNYRKGLFVDLKVVVETKVACLIRRLRLKLCGRRRQHTLKAFFYHVYENVRVDGELRLVPSSSYVYGDL
jgi:hypothetical protein